MGQQQLLLIVLGVIIVGIAIAVGINMFSSNAISSNRDAVVNDLNNLAAKMQTWYRKPVEMGGGGQTFAGITSTADAVNKGIWNTKDVTNGNGNYSVMSGGTTTDILIGGKGKEVVTSGGTDTVQVQCTVSSSAIIDSVLK